MHEGIRRLVVAIRWLSILWLGGAVAVMAYLALSDDLSGGSMSDKVGGVVFTLGPGLLGLGLAWVLDGFAKPDGRRE